MNPNPLALAIMTALYARHVPIVSCFLTVNP